MLGHASHDNRTNSQRLIDPIGYQSLRATGVGNTPKPMAFKTGLEVASNRKNLNSKEETKQSQKVKPLMSLNYIKNPDEIYQRSFEIVQNEADLSRFDTEEAKVATRIIHASGMPEICNDLKFSPTVIKEVLSAISRNAKIICDCNMVTSGISISNDSNLRAHCFLDHPSVLSIANMEQTTRSAAQVTLWREHQAGAIIVIGNAPTALFRIIEEIESGAPMPSAILGFPVGFVGATESKEALARTTAKIPHITLFGRRGGSAIAAAAINALIRISIGQDTE